MLLFSTLWPRLKQKQFLIDTEIRLMPAFSNVTWMGRSYCFYCLIMDVW